MHARPEQPERIFGVVKVHAECAVGKSQEPTVAAAPIQIPDDAGVWWICEKHADAMPWFEGVGVADAPLPSSTTSHQPVGSTAWAQISRPAEERRLLGDRGKAGRRRWATARSSQRLREHANELPIY